MFEISTEFTVQCHGLNPATAGLAHIFNHFYMNVYLSLSCKISVHLVYPTVIGACCLIKVSRRQNKPKMSLDINLKMWMQSARKSVLQGAIWQLCGAEHCSEQHMLAVIKVMMMMVMMMMTVRMMKVLLAVNVFLHLVVFIDIFTENTRKFLKKRRLVAPLPVVPCPCPPLPDQEGAVDTEHWIRS